MSEVLFCWSVKVNNLQLNCVYSNDALHHSPECWYKMTNCHQWGRHVPMLRNPTPSGFFLTAKNTSRIWTSIWYHPRCLHSHASASQTQTLNILSTDFISHSGVLLSQLFFFPLRPKQRNNRRRKVQLFQSWNKAAAKSRRKIQNERLEWGMISAAGDLTPVLLYSGCFHLLLLAVPHADTDFICS